MTAPATRAVIRPIDAGGEDNVCPTSQGGCGAAVKFVAQHPSRFRLRVLANVYWQGQWNRVEQWHCHCYVAAGMPYGRPANLADDHLELIKEALATEGDTVTVMVALARERQFTMHISAQYNS